MKNPSERGFSLIELLITSAIILIGLLAVLPLLESLSLSNRHLSRKLDQLDDKSSVMVAMTSPQVCSCHLNPALNDAADDDSRMTFDKTDPAAAIEISKIRGGCAADSGDLFAPTIATEGGLVPKSIKVRNFEYTGVGKEWTGTLALAYETPAGDVPYADTEISLRFNVDDSNPAATKIACCSGASPFSCNPPIPTVPATADSGGGGGSITTVYYSLVGFSYPGENVVAGCTSPKIYAELWERSVPYASPTDTGESCQVVGGTPPTYQCYQPVSPERMVWSGCY
ncbi:MAG: prepilin-type N-terminal cleavage/methylation domain-containing protein [Bdellovibrionota bacterium]